jgi:hypothetical protein
MTWRPLTAVILVLGLTGCASMLTRGRSVESLVSLLAAPGTGKTLRMAAAKELARRPSEEVLPRIWPLRVRFGPQIADWGSAARYRDCTWEAAVGYAASWAWAENLEARASSPERTSEVLLRILRGLDGADGKVGLLHDLRYYGWNGSAEQEAVVLFRMSSTDLQARYALADILLATCGGKYFGEVLELATRAVVDPAELSAPSMQGSFRDTLEAQGWFARLLLQHLDPRHKPQVLAYAFEVMQRERAVNPRGGYFLATALEKPTGMRFQPDPEDPRYHPKFNDLYFQDYVTNALRWWEQQTDSSKADEAPPPYVLHR